MLTLGEHAQVVADLEHFPKEQVYAKHNLTDPDLREAVLQMCNERLKDPETKERWDSLYKRSVSMIREKQKKA
jgi:hypothetical protein